jgi:hypothetical protein
MALLTTGMVYGAEKWVLWAFEFVGKSERQHAPRNVEGGLLALNRLDGAQYGIVSEIALN